jgi:hypothetical protein
MPITVYVCYGLYVIYTGVYFYNRTHGKSAQFGVTRIFQDSSTALKVSGDLCSGGLFLFGTYVMIFKTFFT